MVSTLLDIRITIALSLALAIMAVIMVFFVFFTTRAVAMPMLEADRLSGFKGDRLSTKATLASRRLRWISSSAYLEIAGADDAMVAVQDGTITLPFDTKYAGRFRGMKLRLEFSDPLQLFFKVREINYANFTLDVLPLSLLGPPSAKRAKMLTMGEEPAGSQGMGQELFNIDEYQPFADTKNIVWKRVARSADQRLFITIRESNIPHLIKVGLLDAVQREERLDWVDLLCEGVGLMGKELIDLGCQLEVSHESPDGLIVQQVSDLQDLAEALLSFSISASGGKLAYHLIDQSDVVVTGLRELEQPEIARALSRKPSLLIHEKASPIHVGERSVVFSGRESVFPLIARVVER